MQKPNQVRFVTQPGEADTLQISYDQFTMRFQQQNGRVTESARESHIGGRGRVFIPEDIYRQAFAIARQEFAKRAHPQGELDL